MPHHIVIMHFSAVSTPQITWPIFVISLPVAMTRRAEMHAQLTAAHLPYAFIDAIDGRAGLPGRYEAMVDRPAALRQRGYPLSDGEIACALSHQMAYRRILDDGLEGAIILEDDAILTPDFVAFLAAGGHRRADLVQMCYYDAQVWRGRPHAEVAGVKMLRLCFNAFTAAGYSVSARGAAHLLKCGSPLRERADWPCDVTGIGAVITLPRLIEHPQLTPEQSYLHAGRSTTVPPGFDFAAHHRKGWRRNLGPARWRNLLRRKFSRRIVTEFQGKSTVLTTDS